MNNHPKVPFFPLSYGLKTKTKKYKINKQKQSRAKTRTGRSPAGSRPGHHTAARRRNTAGGWLTSTWTWTWWRRTMTVGERRKQELVEPVVADMTAAEDADLTRSPCSRRAGTVLGFQGRRTVRGPRPRGPVGGVSGRCCPG